MQIKKKWVVLGIIFTLLVILNPGFNRFKEYSGMIGKDSHNIKRTANFLIFSIYRNDYTNQKYVGILLNFIDITKSKRDIANSDSSSPSTKSNTLITDSTNSIPSFYEVMNKDQAYKLHDTATFTWHQLINYGYSPEDIRKAVYKGNLVPLDSAYIEKNRRLKLWMKISDDDFFKQSFEEFEKKYSTRKEVDFLYNGLHSDYRYTKSREEFFKQFFPDINK